jgi:hypothetical protein
MKPALAMVWRAKRCLQAPTPEPGPTRTITLTEARYQDVLRAVLRTLDDELETAARELQPVLTQPTRRPNAADAFTFLHSVRLTIAALEALGWPENRDEILEKFAQLHGTTRPASREGRTRT